MRKQKLQFPATSLGKFLRRRSLKLSQLLKSLAHPVRLKILSRVLISEATVNELVNFCGTTQAGMSQVLKRMKSEKILTSRRQGPFVFYRLADRKALRLVRSLQKIYFSEPGKSS